MARIVFLGGVFDLFHVGHLNVLKRAKALGDILVVGVLSDEAASAYKPTPVISFGDRIRIIQAIEWVDYAIPQEDTDATYLLKQIKPNVLVHASDWREGWEIGQTWIANNGGQFAILPYTEGISSTEIKKKIRARDD